MAGRSLPYSASLAAGAAGNKVRWNWFVRFDMKSPVGTKRYTDYNTGSAGTYALKVNGTVATNGTTAIVGTSTTFLSDFVVGDTVSITGETSRVVASVTDNTHLALTVAASTTASGLSATLSWTEIDILVGALDQGSQGPLAVSFVDVVNLDSSGAEIFGGWAKTPGIRNAPVQILHVTFQADGTLAGPVKMYVGQIGRQEHMLRSKMEIQPYVNPYSKNGLWLTVRDFGCGDFMPDRSVVVP